MHLAMIARRIAVGLPVLVLCLAALPEASAWDLFGSEPKVQSGGASGHTQPRRGPLFHGQELRMPTMPFMRKKTPPQPPVNRAQAATNRVPQYSGAPTASRFAAAGDPRLAHQAQAMSNQAMAAAMRRQHASPQQQPQPMRPERRPLPVEMNPEYRAVPMAQQALAMSTATDEPTASAEPELATVESTPAPAAAVTAATAPAADPQSRADALVAEAHQLTKTASTDADYTRVIELCRRARSNQPGEATHRYAGELASWAFNRRGQAKAKAGQLPAALADFDNAIRADANRWRAIHNRGVLLAQTGEYERAFDDFARTIELNPNFADAYSNRAALLMVAGELQAALGDYRRAIELNPKLAVAHRGCGRIHHQLGQLDKAISCFDEAVRIAPQDSYAIECRADVLTDLGRYAEALAAYERTIQLDPESGHAHGSSAWLLATCPDPAIRNPQLAVERAKVAIELTGEGDAVSFDTLAAAQASAGDFDAAMQTVRQAVELAPPEEKEIYEARLTLYQHAKPFRIEPAGEVMQASYVEAEAWE